MAETVFDPLRKKHVALTPEEQVRQYFIKWLNNTKGYPMELMMSEYFIKFNKMQYRCDIVAFNKSLQPILLVECKSSHVQLDNSVIEQVIRYNMVLKVPVIVITNGYTTYACQYNTAKQAYEFISDIPAYQK